MVSETNRIDQLQLATAIVQKARHKRLFGDHREEDLTAEDAEVRRGNLIFCFFILCVPLRPLR